MPAESHWSSQRPTIMDVAHLSGVSKSTVSNVLRGAGRVSEATRGRVLESIEALGYRPNSLARDLVRRRSNTIGVVLGDLANTFYADLVKLLELRISEAAYTTIVCNTDGRLELERARVEMLLERAVSGVVLLQFSGDGAVLESLAAAGVPAVEIGEVVDVHVRWRRAAVITRSTTCSASMPAASAEKFITRRWRSAGSATRSTSSKLTCGRPSRSAITLAPRMSAWPPRGLAP
jgi:hypothetical protein